MLFRSSQPALVEAAKNLSGLPKVELREEDMLSTLDDLTQRGQQFDLVYSGFAMHHLPAAAKARMFESVSRLLTPDGVFLLIDITREPGEARAEYLVNYLHMVRTEWDTLEETQIADVCDHVGPREGMRVQPSGPVGPADQPEDDCTGTCSS